MLDRKLFLKCFNTLLLFGGVEPENQRTEMYYKLMANDFEDKEFSAICGDICKSEHLFGKYPDPKLFYDRKENRNRTILVEEGVFFVDPMMKQYADLFDGMPLGDADQICLNVWNWIIKNKRGEMVSENFVRERLKQFCPAKQENEIQDESIGKKLLGVIKRI